MRGRPTNVRIFIVFYPRAGVILARGSNVVYLRSVEEWLSCVPEVVSNLVDKTSSKAKQRETLNANNEKEIVAPDAKEGLGPVPEARAGIASPALRDRYSHFPV